MSNESRLTEAVNQPESYLDTLVGDGKKYADTEQLAKALYHSQLHIKTLEEEAAEQRQNSSQVDKILEELRNQNTNEVAPSSTSVERREERTTPERPAGNPAEPQVDVTETVKQVLNEHEQTKKARENTDQTLAKLSDHYGSRQAAERALATLIKNSADKEGMVKLLDQMGATDPDRAVKFVTGEVPKEEPKTAMPSDANVGGESLPPTPSGGLTWRYCQEVRKKDPKKYRSKEFRDQMERAVVEHEKAGSNFFET